MTGYSLTEALEQVETKANFCECDGTLVYLHHINEHLRAGPTPSRARDTRFSSAGGIGRSITVQESERHIPQARSHRSNTQSAQDGES